MTFKKQISTALIALAIFFLVPQMSMAKQLTPDQSLALLKEGNLRFIKGNSVYPNQTAHNLAELNKRGEKPFVTIISGSDSRIQPTIIFDRGLGDIFSIRTLCASTDKESLKAIKRGILELNTPLLVVLVNTDCQIIKETLKNENSYYKAELNSAIKMSQMLYPKTKTQELTTVVAKMKARETAKEIISSSAKILEKVRSAELTVYCALYDTKTGKVSWFH